MYPSLRDGTALSAGFTTIKEAVDGCGIPAVELSLDRSMAAPSVVSGDHFTLDSSSAISAYKNHLAEHGVKPAGFLLANNFNAPDVDAELAWIVRVLKAANAIGMPAIRIDSIMSGEREMPTPQRIDIFVNCLSKILMETNDLETAMGIENHGAGGNNREFLDGVFAGVGSERVGMTMDMGNFYWSGMPLSEVYETLEHLAPKTKHTHVKNINYPADQREVRRPMGWEYGKYCCPIEQGDIDLSRVIEFLRNVHYQGDLSLEDESLGRFPAEQRKAILIRDAEYLKSLI